MKQALLLSLVCLFLIPLSVFGCTCEIRPPACFDYWRSEAVFVGTVKKVNAVTETSRFPMETVEISVDESFRGVSAPLVMTYNYGHSCAFTFRAEDSFLFYGGLDGTTEFSTSYCTRTTRLRDDLGDLEFLKAVKEKREVYWVWGTISEFGYMSPLPGIRAEVLGQTKKIESVSNGAGDIKLEVPKPGTYRIRIYLPKDRNDFSGPLRADEEIRELQRKQIIGGKFRGSRPYVDYQVQVESNRCGWFDVLLRDKY